MQEYNSLYQMAITGTISKLSDGGLTNRIKGLLPDLKVEDLETEAVKDWLNQFILDHDGFMESEESLRSALLRGYGQVIRPSTTSVEEASDTEGVTWGTGDQGLSLPSPPDAAANPSSSSTSLSLLITDGDNPSPEESKEGPVQEDVGDVTERQLRMERRNLLKEVHELKEMHASVLKHSQSEMETVTELYEAKLSDLSKSLELLDNQKSSLLSEVSDLHSQLEEVTDQLDDLHDKYSTVLEEKELLKDEIQAMKKRTVLTTLDHPLPTVKRDPAPAVSIAAAAGRKEHPHLSHPVHPKLQLKAFPASGVLSMFDFAAFKTWQHSLETYLLEHSIFATWELHEVFEEDLYHVDHTWIAKLTLPRYADYHSIPQPFSPRYPPTTSFPIYIFFT